MLTSRPLSSLLLVSAIVATSLACSSGGSDTDTVIKIVPGGGGSGAGSGGSAGGAAPPTAGGSAIAGSDSGQAGAQAMGGSAGSGGSAGVSAGGMAGVGGSGGTAGSGAAGGTGDDPNKKVLFDGSTESFNNWVSIKNGAANPWKNNGDGTMTVQTNTGDIVSKETFQDVFIHLEYKTPKITSDGGGQQRGNSGVYLKSSYEMQILDTFGQPPAIDGCGALYSISAPLVVACNKEDEWNVYEIEFKANVCTNGQKTGNASFIEVKLNDTVVQKNVVADHFTQAGQAESCDPKGLLLQDHSSILPVSFRNIWAIPRN